MDNPRTFRIDRGIGHYDFNDYYAVLGLPLTAEASYVRKRYLLIAKCLHPDVHGRTPAEKQVATQYLSKLVNPAYDVLSQERERTEYSAILKLLGKRLIKRNQKFLPQSNLAKRYLIAKDINYEQAINEIAKSQYQNLDMALENIGLLSELNLVHILLQEGYSHSSESSGNGSVIPAKPPQNQPNNPNANVSNSAATANRVNQTQTNSSSVSGSYQMRSEAQSSQRPAANKSTASNYTGAANTSGSSSGSTSGNATRNVGQTNNNASSGGNGAINQYIRQAELYISQQLWASALKELRSAIQIDCNNSKCHALLGFVYMNQKLVGMAKVSFQQALKLNPEEPIALKYLSQVSGTASNTDKSQTKPKDDKKGGFFGWLGGG